MENEKTLEKALDPSRPGTINLMALKGLHNIIRKYGVRSSRRIMEWLDHAGYSETDTMAILGEYLKEIKDASQEKIEEVEDKKMSTIVSVVKKLLKNDTLKYGASSDLKVIAARLDLISTEIQDRHPDLSLAIDLISDRLERLAFVPVDLKDFYEEYRKFGGRYSLETFLSKLPEFIKYCKLSSKDIAEWDNSKE